MMPEVWSPALIPGTVDFRLKPMTTYGPATFSGRKQVGAPDVGFWTAALSEFVINRPHLIMEWRGLVAALEGGLNDVIIGPFDCRQAPAPDGYPPVIKRIPHSDGSYFSDGSGYSQSTIKVKLAQDLDLRATSAVMTIEEAGPLRRGMYFTLDSDPLVLAPRMYMITSVPEVDGNTASFRFLPTLRVAAKAGEEVEFAEPRLLMRLSSADTGALAIEQRRKSRPSIDLEESWNGL